MNVKEYENIWNKHLVQRWNSAISCQQVMLQFCQLPPFQFKSFLKSIVNKCVDIIYKIMFCIVIGSGFVLLMLFPWKFLLYLLLWRDLAAVASLCVCGFSATFKQVMVIITTVVLQQVEFVLVKYAAQKHFIAIMVLNVTVSMLMYP